MQDGVGSVSTLAVTSVPDLMDRCALDRDTAVRLTAFFAPPTPGGGGDRLGQAFRSA